ncbi:MAG TPA: MFS transporter [Acidimicrobiales bacterium]|jgi:MFS family permease|nr:MFS transporter [Acidimicrobiales bacterium]
MLDVQPPSEPEVLDHTAAVSDDGYKWVALFISTLGMLMATIDGSITLISLPDIFRGIGIDPLQSGNSFFLLWMILGFLVVTSVLVTTLGRMGDIYGRVRTYNLGFAVFTFFSLLLTITWTHGRAAGIFLIVMRIFQGVGAAMLMANSAAILTDAFPEGQRGLAMGINQAAALSGTFIGLVLGGLLAPINWRLIFLVSVPIGLFGTVWGYIKLRELSVRQPARIDWPGNVTFAVGLILIMVGITYGIEPYGHDTMGWTNPMVIGALVIGVLLLIAFGIIETKVPQPMFRLQLFKIRAFTAGVFASFLAALSRGGLMFMLIIWLQGIWLPLHGYDFARTPLWAGIALLPLTAGFLVAAPFSGILSDRYGARPFATGGMIGTATIFVLLELLPIDFPYWVFAIMLFFAGLSMSSFGAPNRAGVMNSLPPEHRGAGSGMNTTFQNSAQVLSIGIFFSLMIVGLSSSLPANLFHGLVANGVSPSVASRASHLPPVSTLFAAFLGVNPVQHLIGPQVLSHLTAAQQAKVTGRSFFPGLITAPFRAGLHAAFDFAIVASLLGAAASWTRGGHVRVQVPTPRDAHAVGVDSGQGSRSDGKTRREPASAGLQSSPKAAES